MGLTSIFEIENMGINVYEVSKKGIINWKIFMKSMVTREDIESMLQ